MAERPQRCSVRFEYCFDRLFEAKIEQVYDVLVPDRTRRTGGAPPIGASRYENCSNIRARFVGPAEGGQDDRQSDGSPGDVRLGASLQRTG